MQIDANDVITKLTVEVSQLTQRAILAEVRAEAAETKLESIENSNEEK